MGLQDETLFQLHNDVPFFVVNILQPCGARHVEDKDNYFVLCSELRGEQKWHCDI
jgi:hypothetical protein